MVSYPSFLSSNCCIQPLPPCSPFTPSTRLLIGYGVIYRSYGDSVRVVADCTRREYETITNALREKTQHAGWIPDPDGRMPPRLYDSYGNGQVCTITAKTMTPLYTTTQKIEGIWIPNAAFLFFVLCLFLALYTTLNQNHASIADDA